MGLRRLFALMGVGGGIAVAVVAITHFWPILTPKAPYNTMLHILLSYTLLPLGLTIAARDADRAGVISGPHQILGSHFDPVFDFLASDARYLVTLLWTGMVCASFDGIYGMLGFLLLLARAGTLINFVVQQIEKLVEKLEERGIKIPGVTHQ